MESTAAQFITKLNDLRPSEGHEHDNRPRDEDGADEYMGGVGMGIMDWQARSRKTPDERRRALFDLYIRRHDRINTWDLVDRSAIFVVGEHLWDKPRDILLTLAGSARPMERRTAILSTYAFIRRGDLDDTFRIAELLLGDEHDLVHKAVRLDAA